MIIIGATHLDSVVRKFDGQTIEGITYKLEKREKLQCTFSYDCEDDDKVLMVTKKALKTDPEFAVMYTRVQLTNRRY